MTEVRANVDLGGMNPESLLTARQAEILRWHRRGLSNAEIARKLEVTPQNISVVLRLLGDRGSEFAVFPNDRERRHADALVAYAKAIRDQL